MTAEDVTTAESKMIAAKEALLAYTEQSAHIDPERYRRLVARFKRAEAAFKQAVAQLGQ